MNGIGIKLALGVGALALMSSSAWAAPKCGLGNGQKAAGEPIKVGAVVGKTGPDDFSAGAMAAKAYFACVNDNGGVNGRPIEYLIEDDHWNPELAGKVAAKLVNDDKVVALVGSGSFVDVGVNAKLYESEGVMSMASACASSDCFESKNVVSTNEGPLPTSVGAAQWAVAAKGAKNVVCLGITMPAVGPYACGWVEKYMQAKGLKGSTILIDLAAPDPAAVATQIAASGADTVLLNLPVALSAAVLKAAREQNLRDKFTWTSSTVLYDRAAPLMLGDYWHDHMTVNIELTPIDGSGPDAANWREVMEKYAGAKHKRVTFSQSGYLAAKFFVDALLKLDPAKIDRASVTQAIRAIKNETSDLLCGPFYVGDGDRHLPNHANMMTTLGKDGFSAASSCADVDSAYLAPVRADEKRLGVAQ